MRFTLALHTDGKTYGVVVPDRPGCFSAGDTLEDAIEQAAEAIDGHCDVLAGRGAGMPAPRPLAEHQANPELIGAVWASVEVPIERYWRSPDRTGR